MEQASKSRQRGQEDRVSSSHKMNTQCCSAASSISHFAKSYTIAIIGKPVSNSTLQCHLDQLPPFCCLLPLAFPIIICNKISKQYPGKKLAKHTLHQFHSCSSGYLKCLPVKSDFLSRSIKEQAGSNSSTQPADLNGLGASYIPAGLQPTPALCTSWPDG